MRLAGDCSCSYEPAVDVVTLEFECNQCPHDAIATFRSELRSAPIQLDVQAIESGEHQTE
jgi:hypothetical protein